MYNVSNDYKTEMNRTIRNESYVKIVFGVSNPDTSTTSNFVDNGHLYYSNVDSLDLGYNVSKTYETLESGRMVLSGKNELALPQSSVTYQGFVSSNMSDSTGVFEVPPVIDIDFGSVFFEFAGLTFTFDETMENWVTDFNITCYNNDVVVFNETHYPTSVKYVNNHTIPVCNKVKLTFNKTNVPNRRVRVADMIWGITDVLTDKDIDQCTLTSSTDLISTSLPNNEFKFTIFDVANRYNPDNPDNLIQYLENGQSVKFYLGQQLENGNVEWIPMFTGYTTGDVSISSSGMTKTIGINSSALIGTLDMVYHGGVYNPNGITLYQLATDVVTYAGYPNSVRLPENLKTLKTTALLNGKTVKECLQVIANACGMALNMSRDGIIEFRIMDVISDVAFDYTKRNMYDLPTTNRISQVKDVVSKYYKSSIMAEQKTITTFEISSETVQSYNVVFSKCANVTYTTTGTLNIVGEPKISATYVEFMVSGNGTIVVKGYPIEVLESTLTKRVHEVGLQLDVANELVDTEEFLDVYITSIMKYFDRRTDYTFNNRGVPFIDVGDTVTNETNFDGVKNSTVYYNSIKFDGAISATTKVLEFNEVIENGV